MERDSFDEEGSVMKKKFYEEPSIEVLLLQGEIILEPSPDWRDEEETPGEDEDIWGDSW